MLNMTKIELRRQSRVFFTDFSYILQQFSPFFKNCIFHRDSKIQSIPFLGAKRIELDKLQSYKHDMGSIPDATKKDLRSDYAHSRAISSHIIHCRRGPLVVHVSSTFANTLAKIRLCAKIMSTNLVFITSILIFQRGLESNKFYKLLI